MFLFSFLLIIFKKILGISLQTRNSEIILALGNLASISLVALKRVIGTAQFTSEKTQMFGQQK